LRFRSSERAQTRAIAHRLARAIERVEETRRVGFVVALEGPLGAGKTEWVKGLAEGFGIEPDLVASPTFVIANEYDARRRLVHADLYRLEHDGELDAAGLGDWLAPGQVVAVEWADRFPGAMPEDRVVVRIARVANEPDAREIEIEATGVLAARVALHLASESEDEAPAPRAPAPSQRGEAAPWR
jgi:tRNA threonylcarbamoyladenosine biosynthesis protein TsaE